MKALRAHRWLVGTAAALILAAGAGFAIGAVSADSSAEAEAARDQEFSLAYEQAFESVRAPSKERGLIDGEAGGRLAGRTTGGIEGFDLGSGSAGLQVAADQLAAAESARYAAEAELADRQANCGAIPRYPDTCPTSAELAEYRAALAAAKRPNRPRARGAGGGG